MKCSTNEIFKAVDQLVEDQFLETASWALDKILAQDPENAIAREKKDSLPLNRKESISHQKDEPAHYLRKNIEMNSEVGTIHHLSCSGGTLISKCLAAMPDVVLLSEINPGTSGPLCFNPFDPLQQFQVKYPELKYRDLDDLKAIFSERVSWVYNKCRENNKLLIVRDHAHSDFLLDGCVDTPPLFSFLADTYNTKPIVTLRDPIDSYLSLKANLYFPTDVQNFNEYCRRVIIFLESYSGAKLFRYEDFVKNPDHILKKMCDAYNIEFDKNYKNKFYNIYLTGDSGRGNKFENIKKLPRRAYDDTFKKEVLDSEYFWQISEKFNYHFQ